ncbi:hypothetical protein CcI49_23945 [Frankia sp. CcI49]|uniref:DUF2273 domain-containing protein n=1 Tax=unclassified Frankia TaxID=2632575 RepID=UPI0006C9EC89|nr:MULTISPECIES: DUF2273 domain-containing protein [unclassified Frankia]KPM57517.1 membrane protein [Frankia sp. R43]ONH57987.1 hypothetical protein CcI49_23945 [Frankia sp. CcI49]
MRSGALGLVAGLVAGLALAFGGFGEFLIVLLFGAIGLFVGKIVDGDIDLSRLEWVRARSGSERSARSPRDGFVRGERRRGRS